LIALAMLFVIVMNPQGALVESIHQTYIAELPPSDTGVLLMIRFPSMI